MVNHVKCRFILSKPRLAIADSTQNIPRAQRKYHKGKKLILEPFEIICEMKIEIIVFL